MVAKNLTLVNERIEVALKKRKFSAFDDNVKLIAVTKNHPANVIAEAVSAGIIAVGENRVQEAKDKFEVLNNLDVEWHLIGHLQTNKALQAVKIFSLIHSIDSENLLLAVNKAAEKIGKVQDILFQVNLAHEESKFGMGEDDLSGLVEKALLLSNVRLCGLMCIAPFYDNPEDCRPLFKDMYTLFCKTKKEFSSRVDLKYLSMGMTNDFHIAIEEGANMIRVGTALFGKRQY